MSKSKEIFSRHILVWGEDNQKKIENSTILVAGEGGLGTTIAQILVRTGVGKLYIVDDGVIDLPDLNRQSLYFMEDVGRKKVEVASERLKQIHQETVIIPIEKKVDAHFSPPDDVDGFVDCFDNYESRFYLEDAIPPNKFYVHGGVVNDYGQVISLIKGKSKPMRELFANYQEQEGKLAILPTIVFSVAAIMAHEIINHILGNPQLLNKFLIVEFADFSWFHLEC